MKLSNLTGKIASAENIIPQQMLASRNNIRRYIILGMIVLINLFLVTEVQASHIVGGDLTYKHISGDSFELNLRIYRDKESSTPFDSTVYFFIYDEDTNGNINLFETRTVISPNPAGINMDPFIDPCVESPPDVEFEYLIYKDTIVLPNTGDLKSYHVASQRCCRNGALSNVLEPANTGIIWYVEILKEALDTQYSTPTFDLFPEYYICIEAVSEIDFSVTSSTAGSEIHYYPYTPFAAGADQTCLIQYVANDTCEVNNETYIINEEMLPPYDPIIWQNANEENQFNLTSEFEVDLNSGIVTVNPTGEGLFLVGIEAIEINPDTRDTLSIIRKEFEIKVVMCNKTIADFEIPSSICGFTDITFSNYSILGNNFEFYPDTTLFPGVVLIANDVNTVFQYDYVDPGVYNPLLIAFGNTCNDTTSYEIEIYDLDYFATLTDSLLQDSFLICQEESIEMNPNLFPSEYPFFDSLSFLWVYNDITSTELNPTFTFDEDSEVQLTIFDNGPDTCSFDFTFVINLLETDSLVNDVYICLGDSEELLATYNNTTIVSVDWSPDYNISSTNDTLVTVSPIENTVYTAIISYNYNDDESCPVTTELIYNVFVEDLNNSISVDSDINCDNLGVTLTASPSGTNYINTWYVNGSSISTQDEISVNPLTTTTYTLISEFLLSECTDTAEQEILVPDSTNFISVPDVFYCFGEKGLITINASTNINNTIYWTDISGIDLGTGESIDIIPIDGQVIIASITDEFGCLYTDTTTITETPDFSVSINGPGTLCYGTDSIFILEAIITPNIIPTTIDWYKNDVLYDDSNTSTIEVSSEEASTYKVIIEDEYGCIKESSYSFEFYEDINLVISGNSIFCINGDIATLTATPSDLPSIFWYDSEDNLLGSGPTINFEPSVSGTITAIGTDLNNCTDTTYFDIVVPDPFDINITGQSINCLGDSESVTLTANVNPDTITIETWEWYVNGVKDDTQNTNTYEANPIEDSEYYVIGTNLAGCKDTSDIFIITAIESFEVEIIGDAIFCFPNADSLTLSYQTDPLAVNIVTVLWTGSNNTSYNTDEIEVSPPYNTTTTYELTIYDANDCSASDQITVLVPEEIEIEIIGDSIYCSNNDQPIELEAISDQASNYQWSAVPPLPIGTVTDQSTLSIEPNSPSTIYTVIVTDAEGCAAEASFEVTIPEEPEILLEYELNCVDNIVNATINADINGPGTYSISWTDENGNEIGDSSPITISITASTTIYITLTDEFECTYEESIFIEAPDAIDVEITGNDFLCFDELTEIELTANSALAVSYEWSSTTGETYGDTPTILTNPTVTSTYEVIVTDQFGCTAFDTYEIVISEEIEIEIIGDSIYCSNNDQPIELEAISDQAANYQWSAVPPLPIGTVTDQSTLSIEPNSPSTIYTVIVTDAEGCDAEASFEVTIPEEPEIVLEYELNCVDDIANVTLNAIVSGPGSYDLEWFNENGDFLSNDNPFTTTLLNSSTFYMVVNDEFACTYEESILVEIPEINIFIETESDTLCIQQNATITLEAISNDNFILIEWFELPLSGSNPDGTGPTYTDENISQTTEYMVIGTTENGCRAIDFGTVVVPEIEIDFDLEADTLHCFNELDILNIEVTNQTTDPISYQWYDLDGNIIAGNIDNYNLDLTETTTILVEGVDSYGCSHIETIDITVTDPFDLFVPSDTICENMYTIDLVDYNESLGNTLPEFSSIEWTLNDLILDEFDDLTLVTFNLLVDQEINNYSVSYIDTNGCEVEASGVITNQTLELEDIYEGICPGESTTFTLPNNISVDWNIPSPEPGIIVTVDGNSITVQIDIISATYQSTPFVTNEFGCSTEFDLTVETSGFEVTSIPNDTICLNDEICFVNPNDEDYDYMWTSTGTFESTDYQPCFGPITETTVFYLEITDNTSAIATCSAFDTIVISVYPGVDFDLIADPDSTVFCYYPEIDLSVISDSLINGINWSVTYSSNNETTVTDLDDLDDEAMITVNPTANGTYTYSVVVDSDPDGQCADSSSYTIDVYPIDIALDDIQYCYHPDSLGLLCVSNLDDINTDIVTYDWLNYDHFEPCLEINPIDTTEYIVYAENNYGCGGYDTATVNVIDLFTGFDLVSDVYQIFEGADSIISLTATTDNPDLITSHYWDLSNDNLVFFNDTTLFANAQFLEESTTFTLFLEYYDSISGLYCVDSNLVEIELLQSVCDTPNIYMPNAFSPNGDGINDVLFVEGNIIESIDLYIVNRWGQTVFESTDKNVGWNGTFLQEDLPPDVYGFSLTAYCEDDDVFVLKGNINLLK